MASKTIARPTTPVAFEDNAQDAADLLENTLTQLEALLWVCHGEEIDWCSGDGPGRLDNLLWLAADLARKAGELFQLNEKARAPTDPQTPQPPSQCTGRRVLLAAK